MRPDRAPTDSEDRMAEFGFLGTGGSVATAARDNTSLLISQGPDLHLIDCPGGAAHKIRKMGFDPGRVRSILITHVHPDHVAGLPGFIHSLMLEEIRVRLFGSEKTIELCADLLDLFRLRSGKVRCRVDLQAVRPGESFEACPSLGCTAWDVRHTEASLAFGLSLHPEEMDLFYSGDTPASETLFRRAEGSDILIHDCSAPSRFFTLFPALSAMHTSALQLGLYAGRSGVKTLIPCHFLGELDFDDSEVAGEIRKGYGGRLVIPHDLVVLKPPL